MFCSHKLTFWLVLDSKIVPINAFQSGSPSAETTFLNLPIFYLVAQDVFGRSL